MKLDEQISKKNIYGDLLIITFILVIVACYNYRDSPAPVWLLSVFLLGAAWFICRLSCFLFPGLKKYMLFTILLCGLVEAVWGLGQLYDFFPSKHHLFKTTGSFFNPGPYGGFIALMFPLALHYWIAFRKQNKILEYLFLAIGVILLLVFPATLSRTAWIAAIIGCILVLFLIQALFKAERFQKATSPKSHFICSDNYSCFLASTYAIFHLKKTQPTVDCLYGK